MKSSSAWEVFNCLTNGAQVTGENTEAKLSVEREEERKTEIQRVESTHQRQG